VVALTIQAVAEALLLARQSGVIPRAYAMRCSVGFAQSKIFEVHGQRMLDGAFDPAFAPSCTARTSASRCRRRAKRASPCSPPRRRPSCSTPLIAQATGTRPLALALVYERLAGVETAALA